MHYKAKGLEIRSENAAKPMSQASEYLVRWITSREPLQSALDFGCGKLRYAGALAVISESLTLVDSDIQLQRIQKIGSEYTSILDYSKAHWPHSRTLNFEQFLEDPIKYDFVLCANVLSTIPSRRARASVLRAISGALKANGISLFVTQYTNSYFTKIRTNSNTIVHLDGWILKSRSGNSYYGILPKKKVEKIVSNHGYHILKSWTHGQSAYVMVKRSPS